MLVLLYINCSELVEPGAVVSDAVDVYFYVFFPAVILEPKTGDTRRASP